MVTRLRVTRHYATNSISRTFPIYITQDLFNVRNTENTGSRGCLPDVLYIKSAGGGYLRRFFRKWDFWHQKPNQVLKSALKSLNHGVGRGIYGVENYDIQISLNHGGGYLRWWGYLRRIPRYDNFLLPHYSSTCNFIAQYHWSTGGGEETARLVGSAVKLRGLISCLALNDERYLGDSYIKFGKQDHEILKIIS